MLPKEKVNLEERLDQIKAEHIMSKFVVTIREDQSIVSLSQLLLKFKISGVPVLNKNGEICGIATATDLFKIMEKTKNKSEDDKDVSDFVSQKVSDFMITDLITVTKTISLREIINLMINNNIHTLPVMDVAKNTIDGVIGRRDVLSAFYVGVKTTSG